ncbi:D-alanine--D-alanine ligase [Verrucomicrobiota bacterium]
MGNGRFHHVSVLMGGLSSEREVSLRSGKSVAEGLRQAGYQVVEVDVRGREFEVPRHVEAVFVALHGEFGEDGQIQCILEERRVPYTGAGPEGSKLAFDKDLAKKMFLKHNIPTPEYELLRSGQQRTLSLPVVVKPVCEGSSIGVHRVTRPSEWADAFADALAHNGEVIVERYIEGKELTVGVVGDELLPVIEICAPDSNYDYMAKYTKGVTEYLVPAPLDEQLTQECQQCAWQTFQALRCRGFGRIDLRMSLSGRFYMLELNTIPGFTETSLLPKAALAAGCDFPTLCDRIMCGATLESV